MIYSSSRIQQQMRLVNIEYLINMVRMGRLDPSYAIGKLPKRSITKKSQIVESLILGLPENVIWAEQDPLGKTQLMSGFDIVSSIIEFESNQFPLKNLKILKHLEGLIFSHVDYAEIKLFLQMEIILASISYDSDPMLRCLFVESINRGNYGPDAAQIARNIIFKSAAAQLEFFSDTLASKFNFYDTTSVKNTINKSQLTLQSAILYYLLFLYIKQGNFKLHSSIGLESYSYSRSHVSSYSDFDNVEINASDNIEIACNKIMFMIEVGHEKIEYFIHSLIQEINMNSAYYSPSQLTADSVRIRNKSLKFSSLEDFLSPLWHGKNSFYLERCKTVNELIFRTQ